MSKKNTLLLLSLMLIILLGSTRIATSDSISINKTWIPATLGSFELDCSSTEDWVLETEQALHRPIQDNVTLHSDGNRFNSSVIPFTEDTYHGGLFYYELDYPVLLGDILSFAVNITHPGTEDRMGWSRISLVDETGKESMYVAQSDAWYQTSTNSHAGFVSLDEVTSTLDKARSNSWTDTLTVELNVSTGDLYGDDGDGLELLVESGNYDPDRLITHVAAYFGTKEAYNYESDFINHIKIEVDTEVTINHPSDLEYDQGTTGNSITWLANCTAPSSYTVTQNGTSFDSGSWEGHYVTITVDDLAPGTHLFQITVEDGWAASATDQVLVTVVPAPMDILPMLLIAGGGVVVVIVIVVILKKR